MTLGQKIQTLRHDAGLSQEGLGEKLGVSRQAISKWEADGAVPEVDKLIALSRLFEVNLHDLLQVEGTSREEPEDSGEQPPEEAAENPPEKEEPPGGMAGGGRRCVWCWQRRYVSRAWRCSG